LRKYERDLLSISAVHLGGRRLATKVRVFIDLLAEVFAAEPSLALEQRRGKVRHRRALGEGRSVRLPPDSFTGGSR
jgi:hypothetical protein